MRAILVDVPAGRHYDLTDLLGPEKTEEISIGRAETNRIQLGKGLSTIDQEKNFLATVSKEHAVITYKGRIKIKDAGSKNGTRINGELFDQFDYGHLSHLDKIKFGAYGPVLYEETD